MMVGLLFGQAEDTVRTICVYSVSSGLTNVTTTLVELGYFFPIFYNVCVPDENNGVDGYQACTNDVFCGPLSYNWLCTCIFA